MPHSDYLQLGNTKAAEHFPFMNPDFSKMITPTLVVAGDSDKSQLTTSGPGWWTDAYTMGPGSKSLFTVFGGEHSLGGIPGYEVAETTDENPEPLYEVQRLSWAYLHSMLYSDEQIWDSAVATLSQSANLQGRIEYK